MTLQDIAFRLQVPTPIEYKGLRLDCAYKADVAVQERLLVVANARHSGGS